MNVSESNQVTNELHDMHTDVCNVIEILYFAKQNVSNVVDYLYIGSSDYISSKEEAMNIIEKFENEMKHSGSSLERTADKMIELKIRIANMLKKYDLD